MPSKKTIYHVKDGPKAMAAIDADFALRKHASEWSPKPWPKADQSEAPAGKKLDPLDHDGDGKKGGSLPKADKS